MSHVACTPVPSGEQISLPRVIITRTQTQAQMSGDVLGLEYQVLMKEGTTSTAPFDTRALEAGRETA